MTIGKRRLSYIDIDKTLGCFFAYCFSPCVIAFFVKKKFQVSSAFKQRTRRHRRLPVFQIWHECRPRLGDTNLAKKELTSDFFFQVR